MKMKLLIIAFQEYLDLVAQLDDLDKRQADYYRKQLA